MELARPVRNDARRCPKVQDVHSTAPMISARPAHTFFCPVAGGRASCTESLACPEPGKSDPPGSALAPSADAKNIPTVLRPLEILLQCPSLSD